MIIVKNSKKLPKLKDRNFAKFRKNNIIKAKPSFLISIAKKNLTNYN